MLKSRVVFAFTIFVAVFTNSSFAVEDGHGKDWRQLIGTQSFTVRPTWEQISAVCPTDGITPCNGKIGTIDMKDWVWATAPQVTDLFSYYAPAISSSASQGVSGYEYYSAAAQFQSVFSYTEEHRGCPTYQPCWWFRTVTGMTATTEGYTTPAVPFYGSVTLDLEWGIGSFAVYKSAATNINGGIWMWRATGLGTDGVHAYDDAGQPATPTSTTAVANVLANDWVGGARATTANVTLAQISSSVAGVSLDIADGSVDVVPGLAIGAYTLEYRICNKTNLAQCDNAIVTVTTRSFAIVAVNDQGATSMGTGGTAIANVLANDTLGGAPATLALVSLAQVSTSHAGVTLDLNDGSVDVAPGTPSGVHLLTYKICERANATNCAQATATIKPYSIDAVNDSARGSSKTGGVVIASVLANDLFNGVRATTASVKISLSAPLPKGFSVNFSTGALSVAPKTSSGTYSFAYQICEIASPQNCDQATVTVDLSGKSGS